MPTLTEVRRDVVPTAAWLSPPAEPPGPDAASAPARAPAPAPARVPAPGPRPDPDVGWVRVLRARVPALEGLEPGDLAIVPETVLEALSSGTAEPAAVIDELVSAGASGVLLLGEGEAGEAAKRLVEAALPRSCPVLRMVGREAAEVERSIVGYLVNRRAGLDRQAARVEAAAGRVALEGLGLEGIAGAVGAAIGRAVAIEDERGTAVALHAPATVTGAAAAAARYLAQPRHVALRVPLPGAGAIALLGPQPPSDLDRAVAERVAPLIALELGRSSASPGRGVPARGEGLPEDGPPWAVIVGRQVGAASDGVATPTREERERIRERLATLAPARRLALRGDVTSREYRLVAALDADDPRGVAIAGRVAATIGRPAALSRPFSAAEERSAAEAEARATLEAVEALGAEGWTAPPGPRPSPGSPPPQGAVVVAERLPAYRLLGELHNLPNGLRLARALLAPLLSGSPAAQSRDLETLRAVLAHPGAAAAADALGVHRNTLLYRVGRIERRTGWRFDDPQLRLALSVAVRIVQNAESSA